MSSVQTGIGVVYGFPGGIAIAGIASIFFFNDSGDVSADHTVDEIRDEDNDVRTLIHSGEMMEFTLNFTPRANPVTNTLANAKLSLAKPLKGAVVTLSGFDASLVNGDWSYVGGFRLAFRKDGVATYSMRVRKSPVYNVVQAVS